MRILYVSQYFPPEMGAPSARVHELSRQWVESGHDVTVLTAFAHHPTGVKAKEDRGKITRRENVDGIDLVRSYVWAAPNQGAAKRMISYASFMVSAILIGALRVKRPDIVIATSPQLLCGLAGYVLSVIFRRPFIFEVRDLWPESVLAVGAMGDNFIVKGLKAVARLLYNRSDRIVAVGEGYKRKIVEIYGVDPAKIDVITNGIDTGLFNPLEKNNEVRAEHCLAGKFVCMYIGTHGMAHALDKLLLSAETLKDDPEVRFVFVGEGAEKKRLKKIAADKGLDNVIFVDQKPKSRIALYYAACDLGLVTLRDTPLFQEVLPSKIFEYLGMERPLIISVDGQARELVEASGAGRFVPPEDHEAMTRAIREYKAGRDSLAELGEKGRRYVLDNHDRARLAADYISLLEEVAGAKS